ncbi:MAG: hypothetical protein LBC61_00925 [Candidatus Peribacteria bacterium]|nr:hypothetical protein [Candidatus Peribacteria bacterium]
MKYLYYANWSDSQIFFVDFYEIDKEYRLYYTKDKNNGKYKYYSAK